MLVDPFKPIPEDCRGGVISIGNFDGLHQGHVALLASLRDLARARNRPAIVLGFHPHPLALLRPEHAPMPLSWPERRVELLRQAGADRVLLFQTSAELLQLSAEEFFDRIILGNLRAEGIVEGSNFAFGRDRGGNVDLLKKWCSGRGIECRIVPLAKDANPYSSSRIRGLLREGRIEEANLLLGRPHRIRGRVVLGDQRGRTIGFPTANLTDVTVLLPANGVYAGWAYIDGDATPRPVAANIGPNPTFQVERQKVEVHLIDFEGDLYGRGLEVDWIAHLRETRAFPSLEALRSQLDEDIARARTLLRQTPSFHQACQREIGRTITEWLRMQGINDVLLDWGAATLDCSGVVRARLIPAEGITPDVRFDRLLTLESRLRQAFPEVARLEWSTPAPV